MVSVCMPVYNAEKYVKEAIHSILSQSYKDFELLIIDNCSTDSSVDRIKEINDDRIVLIENKKNMGLAYSRNKMLELAKGKYIALMDSDDVATPDRLKREVMYLEEHKDIVAVGGYASIIDKDGYGLDLFRPQLQNPKYIRAYMIFNNAIPNSSAMIRKKIIDENHIRYMHDYYGVEDYKFWCDLLQVGDIANIGEIFLNYRKLISGVSYTSEKEEKRKEIFMSIQKENLEFYGFELCEEEIQLLQFCFAESRNVSNTEQLKKIYYILRKIEQQAKDMEMYNATEIGIMCRKRFGEIVSKSMFLW